jgi:hypothetical protein
MGTGRRSAGGKHLVAKIKSWDRQAAALDAPGYRLTFTHPDPTKPGFNHGKGKGPDKTEKWYTDDEVRDLIPFISAKNAQGYNVYITPQATQAHFILLDDTDPARLQALTNHGFKPCLVQESSPGNVQAIFKAPKPEQSRQEQSITNAVVDRLNKKFGDPQLSGVIHPFRMAGFANRKDKHRDEQGRYPFVQIRSAQGGECQCMAQAIDQIRAAAKAQAEKIAQEKAQAVAQERRERLAAFNPSRSYSPRGRDKDLSQVEFLFCQERCKYERLARSKGWPLDDSRLDFRAAKEIVMRYGTEKTAAAIKSCSPAIADRHRNLDDYATRTAANAKTKVRQERAAMSRDHDCGMSM